MTFNRFISLGPTCVPAEILKASSMRSCTYGFDWFRSGGYFIKQFLKLDLHHFLHRYVYNPCIPLSQLSQPSLSSVHTAEPSPIEAVYGFPYLYNPHRDYSEQSTRDYFYRCFERLDLVLSSDQSFIFVIADYTNKPGAVFLDRGALILKFLEESFNISRFKFLKPFHIFMIRISLEDIDGSFISYETQFVSEYSSILTFRCPSYMDDPSIRSSLYRYIGRRILTTTSLSQ